MLPRVQVFCWMLVHDRLLTNCAKVKRRLASSAYYALCQSAAESTLHALRDCSLAVEVWSQLGAFKKDPAFFSYELNDWLAINIKGQVTNRGKMEDEGLDWRVVFVASCWMLWKW